MAPLLVGVGGTALVWATPIASFVRPDNTFSTAIGFFVQLVIFTLPLSLGEELGWRGYLLPRLLSVGRARALLLVGLVWAAWHLPLIFLTPLCHPDGNRWLVLPLFSEPSWPAASSSATYDCGRTAYGPPPSPIRRTTAPGAP